jgi:flagellar biosynthesis protein FlhF
VTSQGLARLWQKTRAVEVFAYVPEEGARFREETRCQSVATFQTLTGSDFASGSTRIPPALHDGSERPHIFIGPAGIGKTTLLCKWMTLSVLNESRLTRVWRLDGSGANTAEFLNIYTEMLGITTERFWDPSSQSPVFGQPGCQENTDPNARNPDLLLIDLPGVQPSDLDAMQALNVALAALPSPRVHLVLNAAYETSILLQQFRAFSRFQPEDLSFTHLDEEKDQTKLLDFIMGTNCCLRFLSTGQKIPGDLVVADSRSRACSEFAP